MAQVTLGTLRRCPRALRHARLPALHRGVSPLGTALRGSDGRASPRPDPGGIGAALRPARCSHPRRPLLRGAGGGPRRPGALSCVISETRAPHLAPPADRLRRRPQPSKASATIHRARRSANRTPLFARSVNSGRDVQKCGKRIVGPKSIRGKKTRAPSLRN